MLEVVEVASIICQLPAPEVQVEEEMEEVQVEELQVLQIQAAEAEVEAVPLRMEVTVAKVS